MSFLREGKLTAFHARTESCAIVQDNIRYEAVLEPFGRYSVFDAQAGRPADACGHTLMGLEQEDAFYLCLLLNKGVAITPALLRQHGVAPSRRSSVVRR